MTSRYVPPHLRNKLKDDTQESGTIDHLHSTEVLARRRLSDLKLSDNTSRPLYTLAELNHHFGSSLVHSTLRDTSAKPGSLGFVLLFRGANPRWRTDHVIFAHTNINILPGYAKFKEKLQGGNVDGEDDTVKRTETASQTSHGTDEPVQEANNLTGHSYSNNIQAETSEQAQTPAENESDHLTNTTPIFMEVGRQGGPRKFMFHGHFRLASVEFLKPQSPELVRMLQQKWQPAQRNPNVPPSQSKTRDAAAWANSLSQEWAVLQFDTIPKDEVPEDPKIEILPDQPKDLDIGGDGNPAS